MQSSKDMISAQLEISGRMPGYILNTLADGNKTPFRDLLRGAVADFFIGCPP